MRDRDDVDARIAELARAGDGGAGACPEESRWIDLARGGLPSAEAERLRGHLASCARCVETALDARRFLAAVGATGAPATAVRRWRRVVLVAACLVVAAGLAFLVSRREAPPDPLARWAQGPIAPPQRIAGSVDEELVYRGGDAGPGGAADLARGYALLTSERAAEARAPLAAAAAAADAGLAAEARWYLALACLRAGDPAAAAEALAPLRGRPGPRAAEIEALAGALASRR